MTRRLTTACSCRRFAPRLAVKFNNVPKHVATHRPDTLEWNNSHASKGDPADAIRALRQQDDGTLLTQGRLSKKSR